MPGIAVIGAGRIGRIHAENLHRNPLAQIRHIVDVVDAAAVELVDKYGGRASSVEQALADASVDAVVIASSTVASCAGNPCSTAATPMPRL